MTEQRGFAHNIQQGMPGRLQAKLHAPHHSVAFPCAGSFVPIVFLLRVIRARTLCLYQITDRFSMQGVQNSPSHVRWAGAGFILKIVGKIASINSWGKFGRIQNCEQN